jgi:hypothetical protein
VSRGCTRMDGVLRRVGDLRVPQMGRLDVLPWHLSLTPERLDGRYMRQLTPHAAGQHEVEDVTGAQRLRRFSGQGVHPRRSSIRSNPVGAEGFAMAACRHSFVAPSTQMASGPSSSESGW